MKYGVINMETGALIRETNSKKSARLEKDCTITKDMLLNFNSDVVKYLYKRMKAEGKINQYGMILVDGIYVSEKFFEIGENSGVLAPSLFRLKNKDVLGVRGFIKKTVTTDCESWSEVMEVLGIDTSNKRKVSAMKKLLIGNDMVREAMKITGKKVFVANPNILRHGSHTSDFCIATFKDVTLTKVDKYNTYIMFLNGLLDFEDIR